MHAQRPLGAHYVVHMGAHASSSHHAITHTVSAVEVEVSARCEKLVEVERHLLFFEQSNHCLLVEHALSGVLEACAGERLVARRWAEASCDIERAPSCPCSTLSDGRWSPFGHVGDEGLFPARAVQV